MNENKTIKRIFRMLDEDKILLLDTFFLEHKNIKYHKFKNEEEVKSLLNFNELNKDEEELLRIYTGYNFKNINNVLRDRWNYEANGHQSHKEKFTLIADNMKDIIEDKKQSIGNTLAFRGTDINYFKDYGINSLNDLKKLENSYLIDQGFISTSLLEDKCFYQRKTELGKNYNIKIVYMVPEEFEDGIYLGTEKTAYNKEQYEYVINAWNLSKVCHVNIEKDCATLYTLLISKYIYDDYYRNKRYNSKENKR